MPITRQSQIARELPKKVYASVTYSDQKQLEFVLDLTANTYSNFSSLEICLPLKFAKKSNKSLQCTNDNSKQFLGALVYWYWYKALSRQYENFTDK